jgi:DNA polymerase I-like protein with 3'-5' exonuclease and polymerase domains
MRTIPLFPAYTEWVPPETFPDLSSAKEIAIDLETCDPNLERFGPGWPRKDGYVVGYAVAVEGWRGYYPVAHAGGGNLDKGLVERWIKKVLALPADKIMHNAAYDCGWLMASGFRVEGRVFDTMLAAPLVDENRFSFALNSLGFDYVKEVKSEAGLKEAAADFGVHPKKELWKLPAMYVGAYAEQDAALTLKLWHQLKIKMREEEVESIFELETDLFPVLLGITARGILFNQEKAGFLIKDMRSREKQLLMDIKKESGVHVDIWAAASISVAFDKIKVEYPRSATGLPSFTKHFLDTCEHPIARKIVEARELNKTHGTFLQPYLDFSAHDGRIHPSINQLRSDDGGTITGRLSMSSPNLQQVPARHEIIGPLVRSLFLPEKEELWAANDFSSQEPRLLVHYATLLELNGATKMADAYKTDPDTDFHQMVADMAGIKRKQAKTIGLGLCIAEGEPVLTDKGLVPIEDITKEHLVWDGVEWVTHGGLVRMGIKEVITYGNLTATPDHDVWTKQSGKIPLWVAASRLDALVSTGDAKQEIRYVDRDQQGNSTPGKAPLCAGAMQLWKRVLESIGQPKVNEIYNVPTVCNNTTTREGRTPARHIQSSSNAATSGNGCDAAVLKPQGQGLGKLWGAGHTVYVYLRKGACGLFDQSRSGRTVERADDRSYQQQWPLREGKSAQSNLQRKQFEPQKTYSKVYDIINAGPRHRFTVSNVLVSNCYGMGKSKLANELDLPLDEADGLIKTFHAKVPFLRGTIDAVMRRIENASSNGSIRTLLGRKCRFPLWEPMEWGVNKALPYDEAVAKYGSRVKRAYSYKGLNKLMQGSAADQTKAAMIALHKAGFNILLQVHDELALSVKNRAEAEEAARIMATAVELMVPSRVDVEIGPSWGEAK